MSEVSVIIPCFNHGAYLREAIESVKGQTVAPREVIVVDDGSSDPDTIAVLDTLASRGDVRVIHQPNLGPAAARNRGIEEAEGRFVVCLDADDRFRECFIERTLEILERDESVGVAYGKAEFFGAEQGLSPLPPYRFPDFLLDPCIFITALFRKADWRQVGGFCEEMKSGWEDFEFWISLVEMGREVVCIDEVLFDYRRYEGSRDESFSKDRREVLDAFESIFRRHSKLYTENIRQLFAAHLERLDYRAVFPDSGCAEIRFQGSSGPVEIRSETPVPAEGRVEVEFRLKEGPIDGELRLDPFDGPGLFYLESATFRPEAGGPEHLFANADFIVMDHSFAVSQDPSHEWNPGTLFFLGLDPWVRMRWPDEAANLGAGVWTFTYSLERGAKIAPAFLRSLNGFGEQYAQLVERARSSGLELDHVKGELEKEMERRRKIQSSWAYRCTRALTRIWEKKPKTD